jgi:hypothetical protein
MANLNKLIFCICISLCVWVHSAEMTPQSLAIPGDTIPYCAKMYFVLNSGNFTLDQIHSLLVCETCRKRSFCNLIYCVEKFGYAKSREIADLFIRNGISVNHLNDTGNLPIVNAALFGMSDAVNLLIFLGADANKEDKHKRRALLQAVYWSAGDDRDKQAAQLNIIKALLDTGANPSIGNEFFDTPLRAAAVRNLSEIVFLLLIHGADPTVRDDEGKTFFERAQGKPELLAAYERFKAYKLEMRQVIYQTIKRTEGFHEDMPDVLVDIINEY